MRKQTNILSWKGVERKMRYFWRGNQKRMTPRQKYEKNHVIKIIVKNTYTRLPMD